MELLIAISIVVIVCCIMLYAWYRKRLSMLKKYGSDCLSAITTFEKQCHPTRYFSDEEKHQFLSTNEDLTTHARKYAVAKWVARIKKETFCFAQYIDIIDRIHTLQRNSNSLYQAINDVNDGLPKVWLAQNALNADCVYQAHHKIESHKKRCEGVVQAIKLLNGNDCLKYTKEPSLANQFVHEYNVTVNEVNIKIHNDNYVTLSKAKYKDFFDTCLKYPLDEQQRDAILHLEDNNLVIASAGSGKTSTMVGKARYMVDVENTDPKKILIITYTRKAAAELSERLGIDGLSCSTFHALAVKIIGDVTGHKPSICDPGFMLNCFYNLLRKNEDFKSAINTYILEMRSLMKLEHDYETAEEYYADRKKYGIQAMFKDMHGNMVFTRSEEERRICEWLTLHDVPFTYEEPYEHSTSTNQHRQYKPDFSVYYINEYGETASVVS